MRMSGVQYVCWSKISFRNEANLIVLSVNGAINYLFIHLRIHSGKRDHC